MRAFAPNALELVSSRRTVRVRVAASLTAQHLLGDTVPSGHDAEAPDAVCYEKSRGEFLVVGSAYPRRPEDIARIRIGALHKQIAVFGPRFWATAGMTTPGAPHPVSLDDTRAFGGSSFAENRAGIGMDPGPFGLVELPQLEDPKQLIRRPLDRPPPAGFGQVAQEATSRRAKLGSYGEAWLQNSWPEFPNDFDPTYHNVARPDQWLPPGVWWRGDEDVFLTNLHPEHAELAGKLPGVRARCFVLPRPAAAILEVRLHLETVLLAPAEDLVVLTFRGRVPGADEDCDDLSCLLAALESIGKPREIPHYAGAMDRRQDRQRAARMTGADLLPDGFSARDLIPELPHVVREGLPFANGRRRIELAHAELARALAENGLAAPAPLAWPDPSPTSGDDELEDTAADQLGFARAEAAVAEHLAIAQGRAAADVERARRSCVELGLDWDAKLADAAASSSGPPKWTPEATLSAVARAADALRNAGIADELNRPLEALHDEDLHASLRQARASMLDLYRRYAHGFPPASSLHAGAVFEVRAQILAALARRESLADGDFTGADLSRLSMERADFHGALLEKADLHGSNLTGADFSGAVLTRADLGDCTTTGIKLSGANLGEARLGKLDLSGVDLRRTVLVRADLKASNLRGANLDGADLADVDLTGADLSGASAQKAQFQGASVERVNFTGADLRGAIFQKLDLAGLDFTGANLERAEFIDCHGEKATFAKANLTNARFAYIDRRSCFDGADFSGANLQHANLRDLELRGAHFAGADLDEADLSKSDCEGANFYRVRAKSSMWMRTRLKKANLAGANLREAMMKDADISSANLKGANLFGANLLFVRVDGATLIADAELGQLAFRKERDHQG